MSCANYYIVFCSLVMLANNIFLHCAQPYFQDALPEKLSLFESQSPTRHNVMGNQPVCHPCTPFLKKDIAVVKSRHFYASLDPRDQRVPRVFVQTHDHVASLSDWTDEQWQEFG